MVAGVKLQLRLGLDSEAFSVIRTLARLLSICRRACPRFAAALFHPRPDAALESSPALSLKAYLAAGLS